jgi:hypothetical protein
MQMYEEKFESNKTLYFHDLWEYAERKLASADGSTTVITHPCAAKQHPSAPDSTKPFQAGMYVKQALEIDTINELSLELQKLIDDEHTPAAIRH